MIVMVLGGYMGNEMQLGMKFCDRETVQLSEICEVYEGSTGTQVERRVRTAS